MHNITLRPYQQECVDLINNLDSGSYIINLATGLGKTIIFTQIKRKGRTLILAHREELVKQPIKYYDCPVGIEMADQSSYDEPVVIASVQSLIRRLDNFSPYEFDTIITDECHHSASKSYKAIYNHFKPRLHLGFSATVNRGDKVRLDDVYSKIIFQRGLRWGIENNYLSDIFCRRVNIGYDLDKVRTRLGDYAPGELEGAMEGTADAIAQAYRDLGRGATLIFAVSVKHANDIASKIKGAAVVTAKTKDRQNIIKAFTDGHIPCLVNCMVFTEGTDIPKVETIIIARPTQSDSLYSQMVGRGLRLYDGKGKLQLIDCVGVSGTADLCTAPSLLGIDLKGVPDKNKDDVQGDLFDLPVLAMRASDTPESWITNIEVVKLWAKKKKYNTHNVNYFKMPNGDLVCSLPERKRLTIPCPNELGKTVILGKEISIQEAFDLAYKELTTNYGASQPIWNLDIAKHWGSDPATDKQMRLIRNKGINIGDLTKLQANQILNRVM